MAADRNQFPVRLSFSAGSWSLVTIHSSYRNDPAAIWLRGNLHAHTTNSDGPCSPQETIHAYAARGYDFLALSDHDRVSPLSGLDRCGMTLLSANEITANGPHMLHIGAHTVIEPFADRQQVLNAVRADAGFAIMCHPNWETHFNHCSQEKLETWEGYSGIEIFNEVADRQEGSAIATDRWDRLLSGGRRVWGYANDDCHCKTDFGMAWNVAQCTSRESDAVLHALAAGHFYASTGVFIDTLRVAGSTICIQASQADRIVAISDWGRRYAYTNGNELALQLPDDATFSYLRFECSGRSGAKAWTQPFFIEH